MHSNKLDRYNFKLHESLCHSARKKLNEYILLSCFFILMVNKISSKKKHPNILLRLSYSPAGNKYKRHSNNVSYPGRVVGFRWQIEPQKQCLSKVIRPHMEWSVAYQHYQRLHESPNARNGQCLPTSPSPKNTRY